jgi:RNA polymerase sigma-70 factor (ECF subfamily)
MGADPDRDIWRALQAGDAGAIRTLLERHGPLLLRFIHAHLRNAPPEDLEEVLNDTLLAVWRDIAEYDPRRSRFRTWVFLQARGLALDRRRRLARAARVAATLPLPGEFEVSWQVILQVDLALALEDLGALDREIVYLCDYQGGERKQVAGKLGLREMTLNSRLYRVRRRLRETLAAWRPRVPAEEHDG